MKRTIALLVVGFVLGSCAESILVENAVTNGATTITGDYVLTGAGGVQMTSLAIGLSGRLTYDPVRTPVLVTGGVPTFEAGARIALDGAYLAATNGRLVLLTWPGTTAATVPADLFDATSAAGLHPTLTQETYTTRISSSTSTITYTRLVLELDPTLPKRAVSIMPFGDSITENSIKIGFANPNYRAFLMQKLAARGYDPTCMGFRRTINQDAAGICQEEKYSWHGGISGIRLQPKGDPNNRGGYREGLDTLLEATGVPDIILFFIGANDDGSNLDEMFESWTNAVTRLAQMCPTTKILCSAVMKRTGTWRNTFDLRMEEAIKTNLMNLPANQVFFVDPDVGFPHSDARYTQTPNNQHPSWMGHDLTSTSFANAIEEVLAAPVLTATYTPNAQQGVLANVPSAYTMGYQRLRAVNVCDIITNGTGKLVRGSSVPSSFLAANLDATRRYAHVGYYMELRNRLTGHVRWVWADMATWDTGTFATFDFPLNYATQRRVSALHVASNDTGIKPVLPTDDTVEGWVQFGCGGFATNASALAEAPTKYVPYDWNLTLDDTKTYGLMQVYRLAPEGPRPRLPAEVLLAYNRWEAGTPHEIGIGTCSMHNFLNYLGSSSVTYERFNSSAYDLANIEIWAKPVTAALTAETHSGWDYTNAVATVDVAQLVTDSTALYLDVTLTDTCGEKLMGTLRQALTADTRTYTITFPGPLTPGHTYQYHIRVTDAAGNVQADSDALSGTLTAAQQGDPVTWFSASAASGVSQVTSSTWDTVPAITNNTYQIVFDTPSVLNLAEKPAHLGPITIIEQRLSFDEASTVSKMAEYDIADKQCGLTLCTDGTWRALVGGAWQIMTGPAAEVGTYDVRIELAYDAVPPCVRYAIKTPQETAYTPLTYAGSAWVPNAKAAARKAESLVYTGEGELTYVMGCAADIGVAQVGVNVYATMQEALRASSNNNQVATLRTNVTLPEEAQITGAQIDTATYACSWTDGANYLVTDPDTGNLSVKALAGGATKPTNGLTSWQSYALGLDPDDAKSLPKVDLALGADGTFVVSSANLDPASGIKLTYQLESATTPDFADSTFSPAQKSPSFTVTPSGNAGFHRLLIHINQ